MALETTVLTVKAVIVWSVLTVTCKMTLLIVRKRSNLGINPPHNGEYGCPLRSMVAIATCECTTDSETIVGVNGRTVHYDTKRQLPYAALKDDNEIVTDWSQQLETACKLNVTPNCHSGTPVFSYGNASSGSLPHRCQYVSR